MKPQEWSCLIVKVVSDDDGHSDDDSGIASSKFSEDNDRNMDIGSVTSNESEDTTTSTKKKQSYYFFFHNQSHFNVTFAQSAQESQKTTKNNFAAAPWFALEKRVACQQRRSPG